MNYREICRERLMFLCDGVFSTRLRQSACLICRRHMWLSWDNCASWHALSHARSCERHASLSLAVVKTMSPASTLPWQSAVPGVDSFLSATPSICLPSLGHGRFLKCDVGCLFPYALKDPDHTRENNIALGPIMLYRRIQARQNNRPIYSSIYTDHISTHVVRLQVF